MPQEKRSFYFICLLSLITLGLSCKPIQPSEEDTSANRLVMASYQKPAPINPLLTYTTISAHLVEIIFDGLIRLDTQLVAQPNLAKSWTQSHNGLVWTFHLREGVEFHDGSELTATDVAFTFETLKALKGRTVYSFIFQNIEKITIEEPYVIKITLKTPLASFLQVLFVGILPKHLFEGKDLTKRISNKDVIGSGSYKLKSLSDKEILLEANSEYFLGKPNIDKIQVKVYSNQEAVWAKLMAGEVDYFGFHTPSKFKVLKQVPHFNFFSVSKPHYYLMAFNLNDSLLADSRVRQALNYAINTEDLIGKALLGHGSVAAGTIYPGSWAHNPKVKPYPYSPQKALALLQEAGWRDHDGDHLLDKAGQRLEFTVHVNSGNELKKKAIILIQQQLLDIGIQMDIGFFDAANLNFLFNKNFQSVFIELLAMPDPDVSYRWWHSSQIEDGFNYASYDNPEVDRLLEAGRTELDPDKRRAIYFEYQEEMFRDPPGIFLFWTDRFVGVHQRFKGVKIGPLAHFSSIREWTVPKSQNHLAMSGN